MFCNIDTNDIKILITYSFLLVPISLYAMGMVKGKSGRYFFAAGMFFHLLGMVLRGIEISGIPLAEKHDTISFIAFTMALGYFFVSREETENLDLIAIPLVACFMVIAFLNVPVNTISPFMRTPWFYLHTLLFSVSFGIWGVSSSLGFVYIISNENEIESRQYTSAAFGWIAFTLSMVAGSIWFFMAHGTYWLWTSKELWMTLTWFFYGLYLHARMMKGLRGQRAALLGVMGFGVALFAYFGVGTIIPSPPTQF